MQGVGMIEPKWHPADLLLHRRRPDHRPWTASSRRVVDRTFNARASDTDTSPATTAALFATKCRPVDESGEEVLTEVALTLAGRSRWRTARSQQAHRVRVRGARTTHRQASGQGDSELPLVKTAGHGANPTWGRVAMAVGKCEVQRSIEPGEGVIRFAKWRPSPAPVHRRSTRGGHRKQMRR